MRMTLFDKLRLMLQDFDSDDCLFFGQPDEYYRMLDTEIHRNSYAHHISYKWHNARPPLLGKQIDGNYWTIGHKCDRKGCVNPRHLENITMRQNVQDAYDRGLVDKEELARSISKGLRSMSPERKAAWTQRLQKAQRKIERDKRKSKLFVPDLKAWGVRERLNHMMDVIEEIE